MNPLLIGIGIGFITYGLGIKLPGVKYKNDLTQDGENEINADTASKKRAKTETVQTNDIINNNEKPSNIDDSGDTHAGDLGDNQKLE